MDPANPQKPASVFSARIQLWLSRWYIICLSLVGTGIVVYLGTTLYSVPGRNGLPEDGPAPPLQDTIANLAVYHVNMLLPLTEPVFLNVSGTQVSLPVLGGVDRMNDEINNLCSKASLVHDELIQALCLSHKDVAGQISSALDSPEWQDDIFMWIPYNLNHMLVNIREKEANLTTAAGNGTGPRRTPEWLQGRKHQHLAAADVSAALQEPVARWSARLIRHRALVEKVRTLLHKLIFREKYIIQRFEQKANKAWKEETPWINRRALFDWRVERALVPTLHGRPDPVRGEHRRRAARNRKVGARSAPAPRVARNRLEPALPGWLVGAARVR